MFNLLQQKRNQLIIIISFTTLAYLNIFGNQFVIDDKTFIVDWQGKNSFDMVGFFKGNVPLGHEGVYRPLRSVFYAFYYSLFGTNPIGYHFHSILVHLASTVLVYFITRELLNAKRLTTNAKQARNDERKTTNAEANEAALSLKPSALSVAPFVAALLFGLHPIHTETITYIASSMEATGIAFAFLAFYLYLLGKKYYWWSVGAASAAFFTHEITLILPILILLYEWTIGKKFKVQSSKFKVKELLVYLPFFAGAGVYLLIRFLILHIGARGPYLAGSVWLTFLTMTKVFIKYLTLLVMPANLANNHVISPGIEAFVYRDYRQEAILAQSLFDSDILISLAILFAIVLGAVMIRKSYPVISFSVFWIFISLLPVAEIVPQGSVFNEKNLYLASFGFVLFAAYILAVFFKKGFEYIALAILVMVGGFYLSSTLSRNRDWRDNITLWSSDTRLYPADNAYAYFQLGNAYAGLGAVQEAINNYQQSYQINPNFVVALASIGKVYNDAGRQDLAIDFYKKSLEVNPYFWEGYLNLANIYFRRADFDLAKVQYENILKVAPNFTQVEENLKNLPEIREATRAGKADENVWLKYHKVGGLSMAAPSAWKVRPGFNRLTVTDETGEFEANFVISTRNAKEPLEDYLKEQTKTYGKLVNEGLALIPNFDKAYVKVWSFDSFGSAQDKSAQDRSFQDREGVQTEQEKTILQFFLFKENQVVEIVVSPGNSPQMQIFDIVLGSIKVE